MQTEIEAKFLDVDIDDMRKKLEAVGASLVLPMRDMRRALIEEPHHKAERSFLRIRDEGDKITLTFKRKSARDGENTVTSTREIETTVGDFDTTVELLAEAGWNYTTYQESRRETWQLDGVEIVIDEWPWINPYIEIEGESVELVKNVAKHLGFEWEDAIFGSVDEIYQRDFPDMAARGVIDIKEVRFKDPVPNEFKKRRR